MIQQINTTQLTELHRHLDVSVRPATLLEFAIKQELLPQSTQLQEFKDKLFLKHPLNSLEEVLAQFTLFQRIFQTPDALSRVAFEGVEDCYNEGIRRAELRFSPGFVAQYSRLSWETILEGFVTGLNQALARYPEMKAGLICIATRDYGVEEVSKTVEFYLNNTEDLIGLDLAGNETEYPCKMFEKAFAPAVKSKSPITIHAGEASGPDNIWEAIDLLSAKRIRHGIRCLEDPKLVKFLQKQKVCLEICPTSNWITQVCPTLEDHPLPKILEKGIAATINTDDPGIFGITLPSEIEIVRSRLGLTEEQINTCFETAERFSFLPR